MPKHNSDAEKIETVVTTNTVVEDRTEAPADIIAVDYEATHEEVGTLGTVLTTYGEPVGGRPGVEPEVSE